ncbi:mariner Mos1 transposase [Trichonephila clavipes]|uniref:Mariner Mos1 transposase n=1 Tax=Trichonephila clavipes TaxID=2585209 RepID=A0A8X6WHD5_TRICX|nr:mariner Mos1 transposase [Trichonephila clavipes]
MDALDYLRFHGTQKNVLMCSNNRRQTLAQIAEATHFSKMSHDGIHRKWHQFSHSDDWHLLHDNAPAHQSQLVKEFLGKTFTNVLSHLLYSPDLAPCDFYQFPSLKKHLKGRCFVSADEVKVASLEALREVTKNSFQKLHELWQKCIVTQGNYFEGGCASVQ